MAYAYRLPDDLVRDFVEEVLRTGLTLTDVLSSILEDLPEDAFPGENSGEVLIDMVVGTVRPAAEAAGEHEVRQATALVGALAERVLADLRTAADLAARRERGGEGRERSRAGGGRGGAGPGRRPRR